MDLIYGTMGLGGGWDKHPIDQAGIKEAEVAIDAALSIGIKTIDMADIYQYGKSEQVVGQALKNLKINRQDVILQSKAAIDLNGTVTTYDFSPDYIEGQLRQSLKNIQTDYLDVFLLHRPDPLADLNSLGVRLRSLKDEGLFNTLGVSNMHHHQIELLEHYFELPIKVNQLEMSLNKVDFVNADITFNHPDFNQADYGIGTIEYCRMKGVALQAWGSLAQGVFGRTSVAEKHIEATRLIVKRLADKYDVTTEAIVLAWLLKHPAGIKPVIGSKTPSRIIACKDSHNITLTHLEWYELLTASRGQMIP